MDNKGMREYMMGQPKLLAQMYEQSIERTEDFSRYWCQSRPDRLYLIGSGTSQHAIQSTSDAMEQFLGVEIRTATPTSLPRIRGSRPTVLLVSQSGASTNMLAAAERLDGYHRIGLTGEESSPLHERTDLQLNLGIGKETAGPKTIGYTGTILYLLLMALHAGHRSGYLSDEAYCAAMDHLALSVQRTEENLKRAQAWYERNRNDLIHIQNYVVVGKDTAAAVAREGALKILETVKKPATGYEFEEYLHGPLLQTHYHLGGMYFVPDDFDGMRMEALADLHASVSPFVYRIYPSGDQARIKDLVLCTTGDPWTLGLELIYPCQMVGACLPQDREKEQSRNYFREYEAIHPIKDR